MKDFFTDIKEAWTFSDNMPRSLMLFFAKPACRVNVFIKTFVFSQITVPCNELYQSSNLCPCSFFQESKKLGLRISRYEGTNRGTKGTILNETLLLLPRFPHKNGIFGMYLDFRFGKNGKSRYKLRSISARSFSILSLLPQFVQVQKCF